MNSKHGRSYPIAPIAVIAAHLVALPLFVAGCKASANAESRSKDADERLSHGQYEEAAALVEPVVRDQPGDWRAQYALGRAMMGQG